MSPAADSPLDAFLRRLSPVPPFDYTEALEAELRRWLNADSLVRGLSETARAEALAFMAEALDAGAAWQREARTRHALTTKRKLILAFEVAVPEAAVPPALLALGQRLAQQAAWAALKTLGDGRLLQSRFAHPSEATALEATTGPRVRLIHGDNLDAAPYVAPVDALFADPPYGTNRKDLGYPDTFEGTAWTDFMAPRLAALLPTLKRGGAAFFTLDDAHVHHLRALLEAALGPKGGLTQVAWQKKYARQNDATGFSVSHDHILVAVPDKRAFRPRPLAQGPAHAARFANPDGDPRGPWQSVVYTCNKTATQRPNLYYPLTHPHTGEPVWPSPTRVWAFGPETHTRNQAEGRVHWGGKRPRLKVYAADLGGRVPDTWWTREQVGDNQEALRALAAVGLAGRFLTPKPPRLIERVARLTVPPGGHLLDPFAGSGASAEGLFRLERAEGGGRSVTLVERGEAFEAALWPRVLRCLYASKWVAGEPKSRDPLSYRVERLTLETTEDALAERGRLYQEEPLRLASWALAEPFSVTLKDGRPVDLPRTVCWDLNQRRQRWVAGVLVVSGLAEDGARCWVLWRSCKAWPALTSWLKSALPGGQDTLGLGRPERLYAYQVKGTLSLEALTARALFGAGIERVF